jgi:lipopolysaccharide export system protein LptA
MKRLLALLAACPGLALAQPIELSRGGPVEVTARDGIEWRQEEQVVIAEGAARAVRDGVTVDADRLIARYRPRAGAAPAAGSGGVTGASEIWRLEAEGSVRISTATDRAVGERAVYDMDQAVLVLSGGRLSLTSGENMITARDSLEYWSGRRMAVARGGAVVEAPEQRRVQADVLVGHFLEGEPARPAPRPTGARTAPGEGSRLDRVEAFGNVEIRTADEVVRGDRAVYSPVTGMARVLGSVRITRGPNQLNGAEAVVDLRSGVARLVSAPGERVQGIVTPGSTPPGEGAPR